MKIIVQKFGGTSVTTQAKRDMIIDKVIDAANKGYSPVVVVSAIGRKGDPYATDTLLSLINHDDTLLEKRETDLLMCCGEIISTVIMTDAFSRKGHKAMALTGGNAGIITDNNYGDANVIDVKTDRIMSILKQGIIPIIAGFQGVTESGDLTTLGRGGSDVTASLLGKALDAECIEIYTDVDGVMTADPRIVPDAKIIDSISYNEVFDFAAQGAKVVHPRAVEYAMQGNIPLLIKNTMSDAKGTLITSLNQKTDSIVTGITSLTDRIQITVNSCQSLTSSERDILELIAERNISIDLINIFPKQKVFTIDSNRLEDVEDVLKHCGVDYKITTNCCKISVLGNGMRGKPGTMASILRSLYDNNVEVLQTVDSHTTIWCLIREQDNSKAVNALHKAFFN